MNRRGFLSSCLALAAAPAIVRADSLMRIVPRDVDVLKYTEFEWKQVVAPITIVPPLDDDGFSRIIAETLKARRAEIASAIIARNALLADMMRAQLLTKE